MTTARLLDKVRIRLGSLRSVGRRADCTIMVAGDSLCTGRAPRMLSRRLKSARAGAEVTVVARGGISIDQLTELLSHCDAACRGNAAVGVIILVGGNHAKQGFEPTKASITGSLCRCLDMTAWRWPRSFTVLCTVPIPGVHPALRPDAPAVTTTAINPAIRAVAASRDALLCELEQVFVDEPGARTDGVHPTASGDRLLAERWFQAVWPLLAGAADPEPIPPPGPLYPGH